MFGTKSQTESTYGKYQPAAAPTAVPSPAAAPVAAAAAKPSRPSHTDIARAAFARWQSQGGDAEANWLHCERQLMEGSMTPPAAASRAPIAKR